MRLPLARTVPRWFAPVVATGARLAVSLAIGLLSWACAPSLLGWHTTVVSSGSMSPDLMPGDVISYRPGVDPLAGQVVLFQDPGQPEQLVSHRVQRVLPDGSLITRGDANPTPDSTPVPRPNYLGTARLRVPWVGLPVLWWRRECYGAVAAIGVGALIVIQLAIPGNRGTGTSRRVSANRRQGGT